MQHLPSKNREEDVADEETSKKNLSYTCRKSSQIATLVECHTRYVMLTRVKRKDSATVINALINALIKQAHKWPFTSSRWLGIQ